MFRTCALETVKSCISLFLLLANLCFQVVSVLTNTHLLHHVRDTLKTFHKSSVTAILVIMFWIFLIIQIRSKSLQVKRQFISSITNLVDELPHNLSNDLRLRIFKNQEILEKCLMWVETQLSAQLSFKKLNVDNSCQKTRKIRY